MLVSVQRSAPMIQKVPRVEKTVDMPVVTQRQVPMILNV